MKWGVPDQEVDQKGLERGCAKILSSIQIEQEDTLDHSRWRKLIEES